MFHRPKWMMIPFALCLLFVLAEKGYGQEFRIYTKVFDELATKRNGKPAIVSRSLTIFHAGKVYDKLIGMGEVVIFEPNRHRFIILNTQRNIATTVHFDEIKQKLKIAYREAEKHVKIQSRERSKISRHVGRMLEFQLRPDFREEYSFKKKTLTLSRPSFTYRAKCHQLGNNRMAKSYRDYADWICRLNFVLQYSMVLPEPRLKLNQSLFQRNLIPVEVSIEADVGRKLKLRAEHAIHWSLDENDRNRIGNWESYLQKKTLRFVNWYDYQREVTKANNK